MSEGGERKAAIGKVDVRCLMSDIRNGGRRSEGGERKAGGRGRDESEQKAGQDQFSQRP